MATHTRALIGAVLRSRGIDFDEARDATDGLHWLSANDYAVTILDVTIAEMASADLPESIHVLQTGVLGEKPLGPT